MKEDRSPCIACEKVKQSKFECAESCEKLKAYQQKLPRYTLWRGDSGQFSIPGLERTQNYRIIK